MTYPLRGLFLVLCSGVVPAQLVSPSQIYQSLLRNYESALTAFQKASREATSVEARQKVFRESYPHARLWAPKFVEFARRYPSSRSAVDALVWVVQHPVEQSAKEHELRAWALQTLQSKHLKDERLGRLCTSMVFTIDAPSEEFFRTTFAKSPSRGNQARACASLAHNFKYRARLIQALSEDAAMLKQYETTYGKAVLSTLMKQDVERLLTESKKLFQYLQIKHGEMEHPIHGTLGKLAQAHLESLEKPITLDQPAPEIEGTDTEGKPMKLSDFKGNVVLLDFWSHNFPSSRESYDYERQLVERLRGQPFVLLGINADPDRIAIDKLRKSEKMNWRSWWDGGHVGGPIATRWEVDHWPTLVVIDSRGIVRDVLLGWPEAKTLDGLLNQLLAEAKKK